MAPFDSRCLNVDELLTSAETRRGHDGQKRVEEFCDLSLSASLIIHRDSCLGLNPGQRGVSSHPGNTWKTWNYLKLLSRKVYYLRP